MRPRGPDPSTLVAAMLAALLLGLVAAFWMTRVLASLLFVLLYTVAMRVYVDLRAQRETQRESHLILDNIPGLVALPRTTGPEVSSGADLLTALGRREEHFSGGTGELADVFEPGSYRLTTDNLPILSTLAGWKYGFDSPFKAEVYFVSTRQVTDLKWGTPNPIMLRDADFEISSSGPRVVRAV